MHAKQRQIAAALREDATMFGQVIARSSASQQLYGFFVDSPGAPNQDGLAVAALPAVPGRDDTARAFHDRNQRGDVPAAEARLDDDVHKAHGQDGEEITVAAKTGN